MAMYELLVEMKTQVRILVEGERISNAIGEIEKFNYCERDLAKFRRVGQPVHFATGVVEARRVPDEQLSAIEEDEREAAQAVGARTRKRNQPNGASHGNSDQAARRGTQDEE
jgi:hypothetical protein